MIWPADAPPPEDEAWAEPSRRMPSPGAPPILTVDGWDGPLDWLLELARNRRIDVGKLPIAALIDVFAGELQAALARRGPGAVPLGTLGDWVIMAATLALLRSRLLLPRDDAATREARAEAEALRRRLIDSAATAAAADWLGRRDQLGHDVFARGRTGAEQARDGRVGDVTGLFRACLTALQLPWDAEAAYRPPPPPAWTVAQATERIRLLLPAASGTQELGSFLPNVPQAGPERNRRCRAALVATFCGALELARDAALTLDQPVPWASIAVRAPGHGGAGSEHGTPDADAA